MDQKIYQQEIQDWDNNAVFYLYDNFSPYQKNITQKEIHNFYSLKDNEKVLEAGGGIIKVKENTVVVDFSPATIKACRQINKPEQCILASVHQLPFSDQYFDVIVANGLFHHLKVQGLFNEALKELYRVLKVGGKLCIFDRADNLFPRLFFKIRQPIKKIYKPTSTCSTRNETEFLDSDVEKIIAAGFKIERRKYLINIFYQVAVIFANILHYFFGHQLSWWWQKITWPAAWLIEKLFPFKILCAEQLLVMIKVKRS